MQAIGKPVDQIGAYDVEPSLDDQGKHSRYFIHSSAFLQLLIISLRSSYTISMASPKERKR